MTKNKNRRPSLEEELHNDDIDHELDEYLWIPGYSLGWLTGYEEFEFFNCGEEKNSIEINVNSSAEDWKSFIKKIEEDLDG